MRKQNIIQHGIDSNNFENQKELQEFTNRQIYTKGFAYNTSANTVNEFPIVLGGKCRKLHGINIYFDAESKNDNDLIGLLINSEQIINDVLWLNYNPTSNGNTNSKDQYFSLPRKLSGNDATTLQVKSDNAHKVFITFYLSDI